MIQLRLSIYLQSFLLARRFVANMGLMNILRTYLTWILILRSEYCLPSSLEEHGDRQRPPCTFQLYPYWFNILLLLFLRRHNCQQRLGQYSLSTARRN
ncbi:hypothetical protein QL093DRAFT_2341444 [Fusarium oxysporum]|nr:hypothetical protein QL093DRAFT_2341444 [Fusarium oxysporum]